MTNMVICVVWNIVAILYTGSLQKESLLLMSAMIYLSEVTSKTFSDFNILPTTVHEIRHYYLPSIKTSLWL